MSTKPETDELTEAIIKAIEENKPQSVKQLTNMLKKEGFKEKRTLEVITELQAQGTIKLENESLTSTYKSSDVIWYLLTIAIGMTTSVLVFLIPANLYPWAYARNVLGLVFVLFLPGYAFVKAVFQVNKPEKTDSKDIEIIERIALSIGVSIALVSIIGLILYYTPFGLNLSAIVITLFVFTSLFATVGLLKTNKVSKQNTQFAKTV